MVNQILTKDRLKKNGLGYFFRPQDLDTIGISYRMLERLVDEGVVLRVARGLYRLAEAEPTEYYSLAAVCARVPSAIICLLSALRYHEIGTQLPWEVWIAIHRKARAPYLPEFSIRLIYFSGPSLQYGVKDVRIEGVLAHITNPARTVVDCFRFRRIVGKDVALEALQETIRERKATRDEIWRAAEVCRAKSVVGPYLEILS